MQNAREKYTKEEYFEVEEEVKAFMQSDASEADKQKDNGLYRIIIYALCSDQRGQT